jgi:hypothetical protein
MDFDAVRRIYFILAPQELQKLAPGCIGFPHWGHKPEAVGGGGIAGCDESLGLRDLLIRYLIPMPMAKTTINAIINSKIAPIYLLICP